MAEICVVLVEPKLQCNVGFVARAMKNFGLSRLYYSGREFEPDEKAFECAAHAEGVLESSQHLGGTSLNDAFDIIVGSTAKPHNKDSSPRAAISPRELGQRLSEIKGKAAILLGREDSGLSNEELDCCDMVVSIPASTEYATLNISHAAVILFYEITNHDNSATQTRKASGREKEALINRLAALLDSIGYPFHKRNVSGRIFRKVIGRAGISEREAHTLAGIFKEADDELKRRDNNSSCQCRLSPNRP